MLTLQMRSVKFNSLLTEISEGMSVQFICARTCNIHEICLNC